MIENENVPQLCKLMPKLNQHLKSLTIINDRVNISSMILNGLGKVLPESLKFLELDLKFGPNDLKIFLEDCEHKIRLNKLLIKNGYHDDDENMDLYQEKR